jgi:hypothetical protein
MQTTTYALLWPARGIMFIALISLLFICNSGLARQKTVVSNSGNGWSVDNNWFPVGVPEDGDTVNIPAGLSIKIKGEVYPVSPCLVIRVYGNIDFDPSGRLELSVNSELSLMSGANITSHGSSSEQIKIGGVVKYNGQNDGTMNGPAFASSVTGNSPNGFNQGVLAIRLHSFIARIEGPQVILEWKAFSDNALDHFIVQKSQDGVNWAQLLTVPVSGGEISSYRHVDLTYNWGTAFYRIVLANAGGSVSYSHTIPVFKGDMSMRIFPNPSRSLAYITWNNPGQQVLSVEISDVRKMLTKKLHVSPGDSFIPLETSGMPGGIYFVTITDGRKTKQTLRLVVVK